MPSHLSSMFEALSAGQTCPDVRRSLGEPSLAEDTTVPAGSAWGMQDALAYKIPAGGAVGQWIYESDGTDYTIWFASISGEWRVTLFVRLPSVLRKR
jgi:hypothetical protein